MILDYDEPFINGNPNLKHCPFCGKLVELRGGEENWKPTYYDPDSGGDPYYIRCECGLEFSIGHCEIVDFIEAWNNRSELISCECCKHLGEDINTCISCYNRSHFDYA